MTTLRGNADQVAALATNDEYTVTDADVVDNVTNATDVRWTLSGADASKFEISTAPVARALSSLLKAKDPTTSLQETRAANNVYEVTVVVTDTKSNTDSQAVMVKVTNVEEDGDDRPSRLCSRASASR